MAPVGTQVLSTLLDRADAKLQDLEEILQLISDYHWDDYECSKGEIGPVAVNQETRDLLKDMELRFDKLVNEIRAAG